MARQDYLFLLNIDGSQKLSIAFCKQENNSVEDAKSKIKQILTEKKITDYTLSFLGELNYTEMDENINDQLHFFEKHGDVWLLI